MLEPDPVFVAATPTVAKVCGAGLANIVTVADCGGGSGGGGGGGMDATPPPPPPHAVSKNDIAAVAPSRVDWLFMTAPSIGRSDDRDCRGHAGRMVGEQGAELCIRAGDGALHTGNALRVDRLTVSGIAHARSGIDDPLPDEAQTVGAAEIIIGQGND